MKTFDEGRTDLIAWREPPIRDGARMTTRQGWRPYARRHHSLIDTLTSTALIALLLILGAPTAIGKPKVQEPVEVQGIVETLNDALNEPYYALKRVVVLTGGAISLPAIFFDVPDGKRLIIESATVRVDVPPGQNPLVAISTSSEGSAGYLSLQSQGVVGSSEVFVGTHSIKLRVDAVSGSNAEVLFWLPGVAQSPFQATINATIYGYLVNL